MIEAVQALGSLFGLAVILGLVVYIMTRERKAGRDEAVVDAQEEALNELEEANVIRDRLGRDPEYLNVVRARFTRADE